MTLVVQKLSGPEAIEALTAEWELLDNEISPRIPFTTPAWTLLWWKHLRQARSLRRHEFFVHALRGSDNRLVAILPLVVTHLPARGPLRLRLLQFIGANDGRITDQRRAICRLEDEPAVIQAFTSYLNEHHAGWDLFMWTGIRGDRCSRNEQQKVPQAYKKVAEYIVHLPTSWELFRAGLSRNMREKMRQSYKCLSRDGHTFFFRVVERLSEIPAAIDRFHALHAARSELRQGPRHRDYFSKASRRAFLLDCALHMAQRGHFLIFELKIGGNAVASRLAFVLGRDVYFYYSGFDTSWGRQSVMTTLMCESFKWLIERGVGLAHMSTGMDAAKLRWNPREIPSHDALLVSPTLRGRTAAVAFNLMARYYLP
jgi:CelD/BcsL family acetyltransferase involved in cellulose biosynthesis